MISNKEAARLIVEAFRDQVTEAYWQALAEYAGMIHPRYRNTDGVEVAQAKEQFRCAIPMVRDLGCDHDLRVCPIYDVDGWWTAEPTRRLALLALERTFARNLGEAQRNARVYTEFGAVGRTAAATASQADGNLLAWTGAVYDEFGEWGLPPATSDYVVQRVLEADKRGKLWVTRA